MANHNALVAEEWRPTHHPDYDVSNLGRVRSRVVDPRGRVMRINLDSHGYGRVNFVTETPGKPQRQGTHRLVAAAFIGPCPEGQEVRHKDDNPANNEAGNLEYGTRAQNCQDAVLRGRLHMLKLDSETVRDIRCLYASGHYTQVRLAKLFGVVQSSISALIRNEKWACVQ